MLQSLRNIFSNSINQSQEDDNNDINILAGLMIEAANTDGNVSNDEVNKISFSLINVFKEHPKKLTKDKTKKINIKKNNKTTKLAKINKKLADPNSPFAVLEKLL